MSIYLDRKIAASARSSDGPDGQLPVVVSFTYKNKNEICSAGAGSGSGKIEGIVNTVSVNRLRLGRREIGCRGRRDVELRESEGEGRDSAFHRKFEDTPGTNSFQGFSSGSAKMEGKRKC